MDAEHPDRPSLADDPSGSPGHHPDHADLDAVRAGEASADVTEHVQTCGQCRDRLAELTELAMAMHMPVVPAPIPAAQEADILSMAERAGQRIRSRRRRRYAVPLMAAAAAVLLFSTWRVMNSPDSGSQDTRLVSNQHSATSVGPAGVRDLNRDGVIDILDAFTLARTVRDQGALPGAWDFNGDGAVDEADAEWLGQSIVAIEGGVP